MKIHRGNTDLPCRMTVVLPALQSADKIYRSYRHIPLARIWGISVGEKWFFGLMKFGMAVHEDMPPIPTPATRLGDD